MRLADIDWSIIRSGLLVFPIAVVCSFLLLRASFQFYDDNLRQYESHNNQFNEISRRYLSIDQDQKIISELYPRFVDLYNRGVIGAEQRLNWYEVLRRLGADEIPSLQYRIKSRQPYKADFPLPGEFQLFASEMQLDLSLLHEEQLATFFVALERDAAGFYSAESCKLNKVLPVPAQDDQARLRAACVLQWYTLNPSNGKEVRLP